MLIDGLYMAVSEAEVFVVKPDTKLKTGGWLKLLTADTAAKVDVNSCEDIDGGVNEKVLPVLTMPADADVNDVVVGVNEKPAAECMTPDSNDVEDGVNEKPAPELRMPDGNDVDNVEGGVNEKVLPALTMPADADVNDAVAGANEKLAAEWMMPDGNDAVDVAAGINEKVLPVLTDVYNATYKQIIDLQIYQTNYFITTPIHHRLIGHSSNVHCKFLAPCIFVVHMCICIQQTETVQCRVRLLRYNHFHEILSQLLQKALLWQRGHATRMSVQNKACNR